MKNNAFLLPVAVVLLALTLAACKGGSPGQAGGSARLLYSDPPAGGALRLLRNPGSTDTLLLLDLVVGSQQLQGFGVAFNLPAKTSSVLLPADGLTVNTQLLDPGSAPRTALASQLTSGPSAGLLTVGAAKKRTARTDSDVILPAGATLLTLQLRLPAQPALGTVFDGASGDGTIRALLVARDGTPVASTAQFAIGKLAVVQ